MGHLLLKVKKKVKKVRGGLAEKREKISKCRNKTGE